MKIPFFKKQSPDDKFKETLEKYKKAAEQNPNDIRIHVKIAELYLEHNKKKEAIDEYLYAARAYQEKRLFQIAVAIYNHAVSIDSSRVHIYTELANLHIRNGFVGDGVAVLEKLANYYYEHEKTYEAAQVLKKIKQIDPDNEFFKIKVNRFYESKSITEEETLKAGPKDKWELKDTIHNKERLPGVSDEGGFDLASALEDDDVTINISTISDDEEQLEDAATEGMKPDEVFKEVKTIMAAEPDQDNPEFHYSLALAYQRLGQLEEARDEFRAAITGIDDRDKKLDCYIRLSDCCLGLSCFDEAESVIREGAKMDSLSSAEKLSFVYQQGLLSKAQGQTQKALKMFRKVYESDKNFKSVSKEINKLTS